MSHQNLHGELAFDTKSVSKSKYGTGVIAIAGTYTIDPESPTALVINPGTTSRTVLLPLASEATEGLYFWVMNVGTSTGTLVFKESTGTTVINTGAIGKLCFLICIGGTWYGAQGFLAQV